MMCENKVALFLPSLRGGGAERIMITIAREFVKRQLRVDVVLAEATGPYLSEVPVSARVVNLNVGRVRYALGGLIRYLRREQPKVMLSTLRHANLVALVARWIARSPARMVVREASTLTALRQSGRTLRAQAIALGVRRLYNAADAVVAISHRVADDLVQVIGVDRERITVIYNAAVTDDALAKAEMSVAHPWFGPEEPPVVLGVGRLVDTKDFATLIRSVALVRRTHKCRLLILGDGPERANLESLARSLGLAAEVEMPGFVENPYKYMKRAAVLVHPSREEGFGNVIVEAMALGTPVIATDSQSGPTEILEHGRWGLLVPVGDVERMARAIVSVLNGNTIDGRERATAFRTDNVIGQYLAVCGLTNQTSAPNKAVK